MSFMNDLVTLIQCLIQMVKDKNTNKKNKNFNLMKFINKF